VNKFTDFKGAGSLRHLLCNCRHNPLIFRTNQGRREEGSLLLDVLGIMLVFTLTCIDFE